jgi:Ti-type conjugative transfer relaxase TraA
MDRRGLGVTRVRNEAQAAVRNAGLIRGNPEQVLTLITGEKSVFDRHDVARALHRYIDDVQEFKTAFAAVMTSPALLELRPEQNGKLARYSTREMVQIEHALASRASKMGGTKSHGVDNRNVASVLARQDDTIKASIAASLQGHANSGELLPPQQRQQIESGGLSQEQRAAVMHITGPEQIAAVVGFAGAGKSTMLAAAREAWERQGYRVHGAALAGKAAAGLEESSGIASRTLASWAYGWQRGSGELSANDIFVIDEAGMVGSRQLAILVAEVEAKGAKLVLVGDHEQLQAIGAGSPFRALVEQVGAVELSEIRRQKQDWQREASTAFATHRTDEGLASYASNGDVRFLSDPDAARRDLVKDYLEDLDQRSKGSRIALAHRRADVRAINADIRNALQDEGKLARGDGEGKAEQDDAKLGRERIYRTNDGERAFAPGDRIVLLENNRDLGVKNGMLGQVMGVEPDVIQIRLDGAGRDQSQNVYIPIKSYQAFDHGYATTIHKSQGSTVDRAFVMASATMDRHLTYVAMTRHRDRVRLYVSQNELKDMKALAVSVGRSGAKETTLDYTRAFAERRGLAEELGIRSEITVSINSTKDRNLAHYGAMEERVRVPADPRPLEQSWVPTSEGLGSPAKKVPPLIPARTRYDRTVEEVARSKALPHLERAMDPIRSVGVYVYADPGAVAAVIGKAITAKGSDGFALAKLVAEQPEQLGQLRGKQGLLGESKERKAARHFAKPLSHHIRSAADTWERRLEAERDSERWMREKQDVVEVPGLRTRSEEILRQLDRTPQAQKDAVLDRILSTPEGRQALEEAADIAEALTQRFGTSDPRVFKSLTELFGTRLLHGAEKAGEVAGLVHRAHNQECSRQYRLEESLRRGRGIRLEL